jgi:hypothetical protein
MATFELVEPQSKQTVPVNHLTRVRQWNRPDAWIVRGYPLNLVTRLYALRDLDWELQVGKKALVAHLKMVGTGRGGELRFAPRPDPVLQVRAYRTRETTRAQLVDAFTPAEDRAKANRDELKQGLPFVQPGLSDWEMMLWLLWRQVQAAGHEPRLGLTWAEKWHLASAAVTEASYQTPGSFSAPHFAPAGSGAEPVMLRFPGKPRKFDPNDWEKVSKQPLPHRLEWDKHRYTVGYREDTLAEPGTHDAAVQWTGVVHATAGSWPSSRPYTLPEYLPLFGVVHQQATANHVQVSLSGYVQGGPLTCELLTASTGKTGTTGLHLPPEEGSKVLVLAPTHPFVERPAVCLGNVRTAAPELAGSFLKMSNGFTLQAPMLDFRQTSGKGGITIDQDKVNVHAS